MQRSIDKTVNYNLDMQFYIYMNESLSQNRKIMALLVLQNNTMKKPDQIHQTRENITYQTWMIMNEITVRVHQP